MKFKETKSYGYYKVLCLGSLLSAAIVIASFIISFLYIYVDEEWGYVGWIVPLFLKVIFLFCIGAAIGHFIFILFLEYKEKKQDLSLVFVDKIDNVFNKMINKQWLRKFIFIIGNLTLFFDIILCIINMFAIALGCIVFLLCLLVYKIKSKIQVKN